MTRALPLWLSLLSAPASAQPPAPLTPKKAFERLQTLAGNWEAKTEKGSVIRLSYRLVSGGSALIETFVTPSGRETLTIYHLDGPRLMATHYCAQGNQPRLRLAPSSTDTHLDFLFFDATNLASPQSSHLRRLQVEWIDPEHFDEVETYTADGKDDTDVLEFSRVR